MLLARAFWVSAQLETVAEEAVARLRKRLRHGALEAASLLGALSLKLEQWMFDR